MTVRELIEELENFNDDIEVIIGMVQIYGSNFAMKIIEVKEYNIIPFYDDEYKAVVITEGNQIGVVDYPDDEI